MRAVIMKSHGGSNDGEGGGDHGGSIDICPYFSHIVGQGHYVNKVL